jgi:amino acid permease
MPFAIAKTGVLVGLLTMLVVGWACDATSCMLIRAAAATGRPSYESLAEWAGGRPWKVCLRGACVSSASATAATHAACARCPAV